MLTSGSTVMGMASQLLHAQERCHFCGFAGEFLTPREHGRQPGDRIRKPCAKCEWETLHSVTVVYDPDEYGIITPRGDREVTLRAYCNSCQTKYYAITGECYACGAGPESFTRWWEVNGDG